MLLQPSAMRCAALAFQGRAPAVQSGCRPQLAPARRPQVAVAALAAATDEDLERMEEEFQAQQRVQTQRTEKPRSKRFKAMQAKVVKRTVELEPLEAIKMARSTASTKFTESMVRSSSVLSCTTQGASGSMLHHAGWGHRFGRQPLRPLLCRRCTLGWGLIPSSVTSSCVLQSLCQRGRARSCVWLY